MRVRVGEAGQPDLVEEMRGALVGFGARRAPGRKERENDVLPHRFPRRQLVELLKDDDAVGAGALYPLSVEQHFAFGRREEARDRFQERRLPAARRAEQDEAVGGIDVEVDAVRRAYDALGGLVFEAQSPDRKDHATQGVLRRRRGARVESPEKRRGEVRFAGAAKPRPRECSGAIKRSPRAHTAPREILIEGTAFSSLRGRGLLQRSNPSRNPPCS
jgi:hypothetical protein